MSQEQILNKIKEALERMGCTEISLVEHEKNSIIATFNCKEVTSFVADIPGWTYSGIQIDPTKKHQYKIDFRKVE